MPVFGQPQVLIPPWQALPVPSPSSAPSSSSSPTISGATSGRGWVVGAIGWGANNVRTDNFNRADSAMTINPASDGGLWTVDAGTWGITSNQGVLVTDAAAGNPPHINNYNLISTDSGGIAQTVTVTNIHSSTASDSAIFVSRDPVSGVGYFVNFKSSATYFFINKAVDAGGSGPQHGPYTVTPWTGGSTVLQVSHNGSGVITVKQNGTTVATWTDTLAGVENTTPAYGGTWCGLAEFVVGVGAWDDFSVTNP